jgi:hypothetical protein
MIKKLPIGIANLREIITENYLYVDKTREIHQLITQGGKYFFLSRPRRFGKSLLISTLKELFSGNKNLFKGLWIENKIEWKTHPVLHIDFTKIAYQTADMLQKELSVMLFQRAKEAAIQLSKDRTPVGQLEELIRGLAKENKVVILIDEYDKPIIDLLHDPHQAALNRETLKTFYSVIKAMDEYVRFAFLTGVSKFAKVSVFSGLNNLIDLTIDNQYAVLLGYTQSELEHYFKEWITAAAKVMNTSRKDLLSRIKDWYNGYSWNGTDFVYNPFSILNFFFKNQFHNFWFTSGTPTFLVKLLRHNQKPFSEYEKYECGADIFESFEIDRINPVSLLFQTGYLTIKQARTVSPGQQRFLLDYPNTEVKDSFLKHLLADVSQTYPDTVDNSIYHLLTALNASDWDEFFAIFKSIFASIPYDIFIHQKEAYYHTVIYLVMALLGSHIQVEQHTNQGRLDAVLQTEKNIFILEFKLGTAPEALAQIKNKGYAEKYQSLGKHITLIGIGFDPIQKNIKDWQMEAKEKEIIVGKI